VIEVDEEVAHYFPFHEDVCEVNGVKQSAGTLECIMLRALNIDLHNSLTERYNIQKVVKNDSINNNWTSSSAFLYLQHKHIQYRLQNIFYCTGILCQYIQIQNTKYDERFVMLRSTNRPGAPYNNNNKSVRTIKHNSFKSFLEYVSVSNVM